MISEAGVSVDPEKVASVKDWPIPQTVTEVQRFIGFASFYRRFLKDSAKVAKPLHEVTQGSVRISTGRKTRVKYLPFQWGPAQQKAFEQLKEKCCETPVLGFADFTKPFILHTDASQDGLGTVLSQLQDGQKRVIAYASRSLNKAERNYPAHKLEFLALKWAVTEKFHDFLYGNSFTVLTDNNPLTYVLKTAKLDAAGHRWVAELANYQFEIQYLSGSANKPADALSRIKWPKMNSQVVAEVLRAHTDVAEHVDSFCYGDQAIPIAVHQLDVNFCDSPIDWIDVQNEDMVLRDVRRRLAGDFDGEMALESKLLWRERKSLSPLMEY